MRLSLSRTIPILGIALLLALSMPAWAADEAPLTVEKVQETLTEKSYDLDTVWTLVAAFLVMWMQAGFAAVEVGFTRVKNAVNIIMKNLLDFSFGSLAFFVIGFGLMFSIGNPFMGTSGFFLSEKQVTVTETVTETQPDGTEKEVTQEVEKSNFDPIGWTTVPLDAKFFFQLVFAATAATIVSGAMAERTQFTSYMLYSVVITALIYPISGHWIWGGGWLASLGMWDFAGSTVVHSVGGWLALVGALVLGPRLGKYSKEGKPNAIPGHNIPLAALGVFILWLGWFGFNPGSTMGAIRNDISHIVCTTNSAAAAGVVGALIIAKILFKKWDSGMALNGALAGLVGITAPCAWVTIEASILIGLVAGVLVVLSILFVERILKIDDPVGAISVHGVCGAFGTLAVGLFANPVALGYSAGPLTGLFYGGGVTQLMYQAIGVGAVLLWCLVTGAVLFVGLKLLTGLRVSAEEEIEGLDVGEHGNEAYHGFAFATGLDAALPIPTEPRPALVPPDGQERYTLIVEGADTNDLAEMWSQLCKPSNGSTDPDFKSLYPYMTTVQGGRFRFRGGDPQAMRLSMQRLLTSRLQGSSARVHVER